MADVFISYAREDRSDAAAIAAALEGTGFTVWWDRKIQSGAEFSADIERELIAAKAVIVCWSENGAASRWVKDEAGFAADAGKLLALTLDGGPPPLGFRQFHSLDFSARNFSTDEAAFPELLRAVADKCGAPKPAGDIHTSVEPSLAVLPFVNMSPDPDQEYFSDGLAEELINTLMKLPDLKVSGRTSSFSFKGKDASLKQIGDSLGVANILEGSVRKAGDKVRVTAQLLKARDGFQLWSERYDRSLHDIFAIQDEIAKAIADELSVQLLKPQAPLVHRPTDNDEAYQLFLQGRYVLRQRYGANGGDALLRATTLLRAAIEKDPDFARAWSSLSIAHAWMPQYVDVNRDEAFEKAKEYSQTASRLDPSLGEHVAGLSVLYMYTREYQRSLECAEEALKLEPNDATVCRVIGADYMLYGYPELAGDHIAKAITIDPTSGMEAAWAGEYAYSQRDFDEAKRLSTRAIDLGCDFGYRVLAELHLQAGERDKAVASFSKAIHRGGLSNIKQGIEIIRLAFGNAQEQAHANRLIDTAPISESATIPEFIIILLIKLGRYDDAMDLFFNNWTNHEDGVLTEIWSPHNAAFRQSDAFKRFARKYGLTDLWRARGAPAQVDLIGDDDFAWREQA